MSPPLKDPACGDSIQIEQLLVLLLKAGGLNDYLKKRHSEGPCVHIAFLKFWQN